MHYYYSWLQLPCEVGSEEGSPPRPTSNSIPHECALQAEFSQYLIRHVLVLPRITRHSFEVDAVKREEWYLHNEDLKLQIHAST